MSITVAQIEINLKKLMKSLKTWTSSTSKSSEERKEKFIYPFLLAYGLPKSSINRLQKGNLNLSKLENEISWKKKLLFKDLHYEENANLRAAFSEWIPLAKQEQRFVILTDYVTFLALDTKTQERLDIEFEELPRHYDFFLPWAQKEKFQYQAENPADVKAAEKMARLFDQIKKDNPDNSAEFTQNLNVFLSRLLFCFFAEDTFIFEETQFTKAISSHTQKDGSDLSAYLQTIFEVLNTKKENRKKELSAHLNAFPYVNGGLFNQKIKLPNFTARSHQMILESGNLDWSAINPDIFGSMIQAVVSSEHRSGLGMHYTSVPNIMKIIEPLFLNELYQELEKAHNEPKKLRHLLQRINKIKIFDPACGSGNFLIIAYKELRKLEIQIFLRLKELHKITTSFRSKNEQLELIPKAQLSLAADFQLDLFSSVTLSQFYGIEIDEFAHEIAQLSLWLAEHQMNREFLGIFGKTNPTLPLKQAGHIVCANACRQDWEKVCPKAKKDDEKEQNEIYILGNPPYLGARLQNGSQKADMLHVFGKAKGINNLDYIACWFGKATNYIQKINAKYSFVTTNSICQGEQVTLLWQLLFKKNIEIFFAYPSFKWTNNAKSNAGVTVAILGIQNEQENQKIIYENEVAQKVKQINPYLVEGNTIFIEKRTKPLSKLPEMSFGSMANDGGHLLLSPQERKQIIQSDPSAEYFIKKLIGSLELIRGIKKYCIWVEDDDLEEAMEIPEIKKRIEITKAVRLNSKREATTILADTPHQFAEIRYKQESAIIIPSVSSEKRNYIPMDFLDKDYVIVAPNFSIYDAQPYHFAIFTSRMHMCWVRTLAGKLETRLRYSTSLCYNTFPFPLLKKEEKEELVDCVLRIIEEREKHSEKTLAQLYDPDKMPAGLREAHRLNDLAVEKCYRKAIFESDQERLEYLFKLYEEMILKEENTLFSASKIKKKSKTKAKAKTKKAKS